VARKKKLNFRQSSSAQNVFQEAWQNMMTDMDKFLPEKMRGGQGKKKFVLWLFLLEVLVMGGLGTLAYQWFTR